MNVTICTIGHERIADWDDFVARHPQGTLYHRSDWQRVVRSAFRKETIRLAAVDAAGTLTGVLPLVSIGRHILPRSLLSMPYCSYGGVLAVNDEVAVALAKAAEDLAKKRSRSVELRTTVQAPVEGWQVLDEKVLLVADLPPSAERLGEQIGSKRRSQVRRAVKENVSAHHGGAELLVDFYRVFARNMRDLGTPVYDRRFFAAVAAELGERMHVVVLRKGEEPVAACVLFKHREHVEMPWAASLTEFNSIGVMMLLYWEALTWAIGAGFSRFDFGRSTRDSGNARFKSQWGATARPLAWRRWPAEERSARDKLALAARIWQRLPLPVANFLGPFIATDLPW